MPNKSIIKRRACWRRYRKRHPERFAKRQNKFNAIRRKKVVEFLGGRCKNCGFSDERALQIDHINGGGVKEKKNVKTNYNSFLLKQIQEDKEQFIKKYQLLCANCNWIKKAENKEVYRKYL